MFLGQEDVYAGRANETLGRKNSVVVQQPLQEKSEKAAGVEESGGTTATNNCFQDKGKNPQPQ